jgi:hypothetical protein
MHLQALEISEAVLDKLGVVAKQPAPGTKQHAKWLEAVLLDMQALNLKQELLLKPATAAQQGVLGPSPGPAALSTQAPSEATYSRSTCSSIATSGGSGSSSGSGNHLDASSQHSVDNRVTRLMASLTPEEIMQCKGLTLAELAGGGGLAGELAFAVCLEPCCDWVCRQKGLT